MKTDVAQSVTFSVLNGRKRAHGPFVILKTGTFLLGCNQGIMSVIGLVTGALIMEKWRKKAIDQLKKANDKDLEKAIKILTDGKGYLTSLLPIQIVYFKDL